MNRESARRTAQKTSGRGQIRLGSTASLPSVLRDLGVSPDRVFESVGLKASVYDDPENRIPFKKLGQLLAVSCEMTHCEHLGVLIGERFSLSDLGGIGQLMRNSPSVGDALRELVINLHLFDRDATPLLLQYGESDHLLGYSLYDHTIASGPTIYDTATAIAFNMLKELCGPAWEPREVLLSHTRIASVHPYRDWFGPRIRFDANVSGVMFDSSWLDRPVPGADPEAFDLAKASVTQAARAGDYPFTDEVCAVLHQAVMSGLLSADYVASRLDISARTLRKRLDALGTGLRELSSHVRYELATQLLRNTRMPITDIALAVGFSGPDTFSRAFRGWAGVSPREWRAGRRVLGQTKGTG